MVLAKIQAETSVPSVPYTLHSKAYWCAVIDNLGNEITITDEMVKHVNATCESFLWPRQTGTRPAARAPWTPRIVAR